MNDRIEELERQLEAARNYEQTLLLRLKAAEDALEREKQAGASRLDPDTVEVTMRTVVDDQVRGVRRLVHKPTNGQSLAEVMGEETARVYLQLMSKDRA